jgi:hypothetical protein
MVTLEALGVEIRVGFLLDSLVRQLAEMLRWFVKPNRVRGDGTSKRKRCGGCSVWLCKPIPAFTYSIRHERLAFPLQPRVCVLSHRILQTLRAVLTLPNASSFVLTGNFARSGPVMRNVTGDPFGYLGHGANQLDSLFSLPITVMLTIDLQFLRSNILL